MLVMFTKGVMFYVPVCTSVW